MSTTAEIVANMAELRARYPRPLTRRQRLCAHEWGPRYRPRSRVRGVSAGEPWHTVAGPQFCRSCGVPRSRVEGS